MLSGEIVFSTILIFQYMKSFSNSDKLKSCIALRMKDLVIFPDNNRKLAIYPGGNINGLYIYL